MGMARLETLIPAALTRSRMEFITEHLGFHLLKPPTAGDVSPLEYETIQACGPDGVPPSVIVPSSKGWQSTPIVKRQGNPYPERISVGRALNCDIVLRFAVVSKLHAHFSQTLDGHLQMWDLGSANGTWHNGRRTGVGERVRLTRGDLLSFGGVHCEIVDAGGLYELVSGTRH